MRVERILRGAAEVFADTGYEAATTEAIAERAEVSIGSVYQYFPNKQALFEAVAEQYLSRAREVFEQYLAAATTGRGSWEEAIDRAIDAFDHLQRTEPAFRAVLLSPDTSARYLAAPIALNAEFAERAEAVLAIHAPGVPRERRRLVATVIVEVISSLLFASMRQGGRMGRDLVDETKLILRRYLAPVTGSGRRPASR